MRPPLGRCGAVSGEVGAASGRPWTTGTPPAGGAQSPAPQAPPQGTPAYSGGELDDLKRQMLEMQQRLEALAKK